MMHASLVVQSCLILCDPMDCSPPGSSLLGIFQARMQKWVVIPFSRGSSHPGIKPKNPNHDLLHSMVKTQPFSESGSLRFA